MPGSLLLASDAFSDHSDISGRSLDSKIGTKKVSFNKAVRVKQYPWKPDLEHRSADHLTLPSNRFWFKVYKNKNEDPLLENNGEEPFEINAWAEENTECIHDTLAPIAEVEDQDLNYNYLQPGMNDSLDNARVYHDTNNEQNYYSPSNNCSKNYYLPVDPPVDYFEEMHLSSSPFYTGSKSVFNTDESNSKRYNYSSSNSGNSTAWNRNDFGKYGQIREESEENLGVGEHINRILKLPRMTIRNDSPIRRSVRKLNNFENPKTPERRSRSHDDHLDNVNRFEQLRKADKSVSTEDLNNSNGISNRFLKGSRDMATQCYGTLNRDKNRSSLRYNSTSSYSNTPLNSSLDTERFNNFRPSIKKNLNEDQYTISSKVGYQIKNNHEDDSSKRIRSHDYDIRKTSPIKERNLNYKKPDLQASEKLHNSSNKMSPRVENATTISFQNKKTVKAHIPRVELPSNSLLSYESRQSRNNNVPKTVRESATIGYLRGRQIPLSEVNTNTNRKFLSRNEISPNRDVLQRKTLGNTVAPSSPSGRTVKSDLATSNGLRTRKYFSSNLENNNVRGNKNGSHSAKSYTSIRSDGDNSMIDWSLSGFQLSKPDKGITSVSDSEYTVHRRPPLLMYIPGVSHHDRPAVEDDRLSALSDMSRSEVNDGLSSLAINSNKDKNSYGDLCRRHSMPRDGKLKWIKWKNKG